MLRVNECYRMRMTALRLVFSLILNFLFVGLVTANITQAKLCELKLFCKGVECARGVFSANSGNPLTQSPDGKYVTMQLPYPQHAIRVFEENGDSFDIPVDEASHITRMGFLSDGVLLVGENARGSSDYREVGRLFTLKPTAEQKFSEVKLFEGRRFLNLYRVGLVGDSYISVFNYGSNFEKPGVYVLCRQSGSLVNFIEEDSRGFMTAEATRDGNIVVGAYDKVYFFRPLEQKPFEKHPVDWGKKFEISAAPTHGYDFGDGNFVFQSYEGSFQWWNRRRGLVGSVNPFEDVSWGKPVLRVGQSQFLVYAGSNWTPQDRDPKFGNQLRRKIFLYSAFKPEGRAFEAEKDSQIMVAAVVKNERRLVAADQMGRLFVWDLATGQRLATYEFEELKGRESPIAGLAEFKNGKIVMAIGYEKSLRELVIP